MEPKSLTHARPIDEEEKTVETTLRPRFLDEFIGQGKLKETLRIFITAAKKRKEPLDHVLFFGPPGLGKTTLAYIIANELGVGIKATSGPAIEKKDDLAAILTDLQPGQILFIDEIHRLNRVVEECLYPALEEYKIDILIGHGPTAKAIKLNLPPFTLIGATTRAGMIASPLHSRFGIVQRLDFYTEEEMYQIVLRSAKILNIPIQEEAALEIAKRSRFTPRIANRILRRIRDYAEVKGNGVISKKITKEALQFFEIDELGLDNTDRKILSTIIEKFSSGPVGINALSVALGEDSETIEDIYEPFLIRIGFINRTPKGRVVTKEAYKHLNYLGKESKNLFEFMT